MQGIPLPVVARLLGHAQVQMTLRYAHVSDRDVEAAAELRCQRRSKISPPGRSKTSPLNVMRYAVLGGCPGSP